MRDMREGINKAIGLQEEDITIHGGTELSAHEKELIEHGYIQCALQIGSDIGMKSESFMGGLQEMVSENEKFTLAYKKIKEKINQLNLATKTEFGEHAKKELEWVLSLLN